MRDPRVGVIVQEMVYLQISLDAHVTPDATGSGWQRAKQLKSTKTTNIAAGLHDFMSVE